MGQLKISNLPLIILAGGRATRLGELSDDTPKFLMPVSGSKADHRVERFADLQLRWAKLQGFTHVILALGYRAAQIREYCGDGSRFGLKISYSEDGERPLGTGGALRKAAQFANAPIVFVTYGDTILSLDVEDVLKRFHGSKRSAMMTVVSPPPGHRANAKVDGVNLVYRKKHPGDEFDKMDHGLLLLETKWLLSECGKKSAIDQTEDPFDFAGCLEELSNQEGLAPYEVQTPFHEIGTKAALAEFQLGRPRGLIILDRDGVLNEIVVDAEHGTIDSPLNPAQVKVFAWVPELLAKWTKMGWGLAIASNQPAARKGKTSETLLRAVHESVVSLAQSAGGRILSSHICWLTDQDIENRRKPKPDLLIEALRTNAFYALGENFMIGDGVTDVEAGKNSQCQTMFLGPRKCDACKVFADRSLEPNFWCRDLREFDQILVEKTLGHALRPMI